MKNCKIDGCDRPSRKLSMCTLHYQRFKVTGDPKGLKNRHVGCQIKECSNEHHSHGYCQNHYRQFIRKTQTCKIEGCNKNIRISGLCAQHYKEINSESYQKQIDRIKKRNRDIKNLAIEYKGNKCVSCGYNKCQAALDFHHINHGEKEFGIADMISKSMNFEEIKLELDKCILLCSNCHREYHFSQGS